MCRGTTSKGERCQRSPQREWCNLHFDQKNLTNTCAFILGDGDPCTRKSNENGYCSLAAHSGQTTCIGSVSYNVPCSKAATRDGYCDSHWYQSDPGNICKGYKKKNRKKCIAKAKPNGFCCSLHDPSFVVYVGPDELRININDQARNKVVRKYGNKDAYTKQSIVRPKHLDHVIEHQITAESLNNVAKLRNNHGGSEDQLQNAIKFFREGPANATFNLRFTSDVINILKGDACTRFIEARRTGDIVTTFTSCMDMAQSSQFDGERLQRSTSRAIRKTMLEVIDHQMWAADDENDNETMQGFVEEFKKMRVEINK